MFRILQYCQCIGGACVPFASYVYFQQYYSGPSKQQVRPSDGFRIQLIISSTSNNDPSQVSQLGMPLRHGMAALNNQYDLKFYSLEGSISVKAANQLFYNLYATLLRLWSDSTNRPFQDDIPTSSARYPETVTWIYVHDQRDLTPSLAAAVFWKMLRKCIEELAYWTVEVNTKDHPPTTIAEIDEDYYDPSNLNNLSATNSSSRKATLFSIIPPDISPLSAGARIETHIRYHDAIDNPDPRRLWLSLFLAWNTKPLLNEVPNSIVRPASSDGSIFKVRTAFGEEEAALAMEAKLDLRR